MAVIALVLAAAGMGPEVTTIAGSHNQLDVICAGLDPREPSFGKFLVGVCLLSSQSV